MTDINQMHLRPFTAKLKTEVVEGQRISRYTKEMEKWETASLCLI